MLADREGRLEDRPKKIKMSIFPADSIDVNDLLIELESYGFIKRYVADNKKIISIPAFHEHQNPHSREQDSVLPDEDGFYKVNERNKDLVTGKFVLVKSLIGINSYADAVQAPDQHHASPVQAPDQHHASPADSLNPDSLNPDTNTLIERGSKVLNGVGGKPENPPSQENHSFFINKGSMQSLIPLDFQPDEACIRYAKSNEIVLEIELERFKNHYIATGSTRANWHAQFKKWLMDTVQKMAEIEKKSQSPPNNHQRYKKFNALDAINGGDGYGNKRPEQGAGRIIDIGGGLAEERSGIQKLISN
jgi:hypothetical protein